MKTKLTNFRLSEEAAEALFSESERTGNSKTRTVEDILLWRRVFSDDAQSALDSLRHRTRLDCRRIIEAALVQAAQSMADASLIEQLRRGLRGSVKNNSGA